MRNSKGKSWEKRRTSINTYTDQYANEEETAYTDRSICNEDSSANEDFEDLNPEQLSAEANFSLHGESFCMFHPLPEMKMKKTRASSYHSREYSSSLDFLEAREPDRLQPVKKNYNVLEEMIKNQESFDELMRVIERNKSVKTATADPISSPTAVAGKGDTELKSRTARKCFGALFMIMLNGTTTRDTSLTRRTKRVTSYTH